MDLFVGIGFVGIGLAALLGGLLSGTLTWLWLSRRYGDKHYTLRQTFEQERQQLSETHHAQQQQWATEKATLQTQLESATQRWEHLQADHTEQQTQYRQQVAEATQRAEALLATKSSLQTEVEQLRARLSEQTTQWQQQFEAFLLNQGEAMKQSLTAKAKEDYDTNQSHLQTRVSELLKPLNETLKAYQQRVETVDKTHHVQSALIQQELDRLNNISSRLTQALSSNKGRGDWGEVQLIRLLEDSGLVEGHGYVKQAPLANGKKRPDIIINLPQDRQILIDSKAIQVLTHLEEDIPDVQRQQAVVNSLKNAIKELSGKQYQAELATAADFVVLYVPLESMLGLALAAEPELFSWARRQGVMLASPLNMMAMLQLVQQSWQLAKLSDDAHTILEMGKQLYKQVGTAHSRLEKLGRAVQTLDNAYVEVYTAIAGQQGVIKKVKQLEAYGADQGKPFAEDVFLPEKLATHPALGRDLEASPQEAPRLTLSQS